MVWSKQTCFISECLRQALHENAANQCVILIEMTPQLLVFHLTMFLISLIRREFGSPANNCFYVFKCCSWKSAFHSLVVISQKVNNKDFPT